MQETDDLYTLAFDLPAGVDHDGLEVSVSGRLLTVKASITREQEADPFTSRGGWVTRSSRVDSVSRSFVLPEGLVESSATASLAEGKAEVRPVKVVPLVEQGGPCTGYVHDKRGVVKAWEQDYVLARTKFFFPCLQCIV